MSQWRWKIAQSFEILWWKRYLKDKPKEAYLQWKMQYWRNFLHDIQLGHLLDISKSQKYILDAGCGPAGIFTVLDNHSVIGLDPLMEAYTKNVSQFVMGDYKYTEFLNQSIESFEGFSLFDYIFCLNAINHVENLKKAVEVLVKSTKDDGTLIISVDAHRSKILQRIFAALPGDILHPHQYTLEQYQSLFKSQGIEVSHVVLKKREPIFDYYVLVLKKIKAEKFASKESLRNL